MENPEEKIKENIKENIEAGNKNTNKKKKLIITMLVIVVAIIVLARLGGNINNAIFKKKAAKEKTMMLKFEEEATPVKAFKVKKTELKDTLSSIGNIKGFKEVEGLFNGQISDVDDGFLRDFNGEDFMFESFPLAGGAGVDAHESFHVLASIL